MRSAIRVWLGAAVAVAIYLLACSLLDQQAAKVERCSVVRCT